MVRTHLSGTPTKAEGHAGHSSSLPDITSINQPVKDRQLLTTPCYASDLPGNKGYLLDLLLNRRNRLGGCSRGTPGGLGQRIPT